MGDPRRDCWQARFTASSRGLWWLVANAGWCPGRDGRAHSAALGEHIPPARRRPLREDGLCSPSLVHMEGLRIPSFARGIPSPSRLWPGQSPVELRASDPRTWDPMRLGTTEGSLRAGWHDRRGHTARQQAWVGEGTILCFCVAGRQPRRWRAGMSMLRVSSLRACPGAGHRQHR